MSDVGQRVLITLADWSIDLLTVVVLLSAVALLISQWAKAGQDVLAAIERTRAFLGRWQQRPPPDQGS